METPESELTVSIGELLPHRPPMVLIDRLIGSTSESVTCEVEISRDCPYATASGIANVVALECMAQAAGVFVGLSDLREGRPIRRGYLIGVNNAEFTVDGFALGTLLRVSATKVAGGDPLASFECKAAVEGDEVANAVINVYRAPHTED